LPTVIPTLRPQGTGKHQGSRRARAAGAADNVPTHLTFVGSALPFQKVTLSGFSAHQDAPAQSSLPVEPSWEASTLNGPASAACKRAIRRARTPGGSAAHKLSAAWLDPGVDTSQFPALARTRAGAPSDGGNRPDRFQALMGKSGRCQPRVTATMRP
jgi:hypothetical protein